MAEILSAGWLVLRDPVVRSNSWLGHMPPDGIDPLMHAQLLSAAMERVGNAIWHVQGLEDTVAHYIVVRVRFAKGAGKVRGEQLLASAHKRTLGSLLTELEDAGVLGTGLPARLRAALGERNWLVHHARRETRGLLSKPAVYNGLSIRAEQLMDDALALNKELGKELESWVLTQGVKKAVLDAEATRLAKEWGL